jgi:hypothetical protein
LSPKQNQAIMKKIVYLSLAVFFLSSCCTTMNSSKTVNKDKARLGGYFAKSAANQPDLVNYYAIKKQRDFDKSFGVAETMENKAKKPDFSDQMVVAVVGKPTNREYNIEIVKTEVDGENLNVHYDINYTWKDLSYTITPTALMTVSKDLGVKNVNFYSQNTLRKTVSL